MTATAALGWQAIVPLRTGRAAKTRLAARLGAEQRRALVACMAGHVTAALLAANVGEVAVLSPRPPGLAGVRWIEDRGRGLNHELAALLDGGRRLIVLGDLPLLAPADVAALVAAAEAAGAALAPDRTGTGTNALALRDPSRFIPAFGVGSLARHRAALAHASLVDRPGLALDVDTPDDLAAALAAPGTCLAGVFD